MEVLVFVLGALPLLMVHGAHLDIVQTDGRFNDELTFSFNSTTEHVVVFPTSDSIFPYRVKAWSPNANVSHPVLVVVRQEREVLSWEVPFLVDTSRTDQKIVFNQTSRTLCHNNMDVIAANLAAASTEFVVASRFLRPALSQSFIVALSTASAEHVEVSLVVEEERGFYAFDGAQYAVSVSPSEPRYVYYRFEGNKTDTVVIQVDSDDDVCLTVSVQDCTCPVFDLEKDIRYEGKYQTVNRKGAFTITRKGFPNGFFLVFVAKGDNYECSQERSVLPIPRLTNIYVANLTSLVNFRIDKSINSIDYMRASLFTLVTLVAFAVVAIVKVCFFSHWGTISKIRKMSLVQTHEELFDETNPVSRMEIDDYLQREKLNVKSLAKYPLKDKRRSFNYLWHILSIAIFYAIPVVQLVITYQRVVNQTGNQDMCYYNFLCAHPAFGFSDFNHIFSNIGYVIIGILFLIVIVHRHATVPILFEKGIPVHYGLFYAMGVALIIEGLLSACYHICPSQSNYQFDTSFMYVMAVLCMVKLYQNRHPDINATAYATFTVLGLTIFLAMVGILNGNLSVWIFFVFVYTALCVYISFKIYFLSFILEGLNNFKNDLIEKGLTTEVLAPVKKGRFVLLLIANLINYTMLVTGLWLYDNGATDFGTFLLGLLMGNSVLHALFYTCMKLLHRERICAEAICYGILGIITWVTATTFFLDYSILWTVTPAESRQKNQNCVLINFYDKHDIWHLLSAPALYFTFMFLLSLDDDLIDKRQDQIPVF